MVMTSTLPVAVTEDVGARRRFFHGHDLVAFHRRLQRADRIDLRHQHPAAGLAQRCRRTLADVAEARDHRDLAGHHDVGAAADAVDQQLAAAVQVVELRFGDAVIDVDRRPEKLAFLLHQIETVHAGRGLFGDAANFFGGLAVPARILHQPLLDRGEQDFLFLVVRMMKQGRRHLRLRAEMHQQRSVAAIVEQHVRRAAVAPLEDAVGVFPVVLKRFALDREYRRAAGGNRGGGVVLRRIDVARCPAHVGAERLERVDQHGGLNGHVQGTGDPGPAQRLLGAVFLAGRHQAGHFGFGDGEFLLAPFGETDVLDDVIGVRSFFGRGAHDDPLTLLGGPLERGGRGFLAMGAGRSPKAHVCAPAGPVGARH